MSIDLEQFHQVFFEESIEGLDIMESSLMELDPSNIDNETVNAIFRSAHSIKGGSATFGFSSIAEFTHILETLLDQVRSGERGLNPDDINLLLNSVDCMREMLGLIQTGDDGNTAQCEELKVKFTQLLEGEGKGGEDVAVPVVDAEPELKKNEDKVWEILFAPHENLFLSGNDPLRNINALKELGEIEVSCISDELPKLLDAVNPESCYLSWSICLISSADRAQIEEIFEWIEDDCDLEVREKSAVENVEHANAQWRIEFTPELGLLRTGNEPLRILRALSDLGSISTKANFSRMPDLLSMDSENCYLSWEICLESSTASRETIEEIFEWVADDSEVLIENIDVSDQASNNVQSDQTVQPEAKAVSSIPKQKAVLSKAGAIPKAQNTTKKTTAESSSIRVGIDKVDSLINMVGELVITQSMLGQLGSQFELERLPKLMEGLGQLEQNTRELQESVMKIRMLPISFAFSRFPRMVRDLGQSLGKSVELEMRGESTELDKTVMEKIGDPLVHLVRNAVDHGIESPEERTAKGKDPSGYVVLNAFHQSGNVVIEIMDDGKGLDREKIISKAVENGLILEKDAEAWADEQVYDLIFQPGFSTAQTVSDVSGRGVGMDVVKRNIQALNGIVEIKSQKDAGSTITIKLPLTLAILDGQLVRVGTNTYVFPLVSIIESLQCKKEFINRVAGGCDVFKLRDDYVPIIELHRSFSIQPDSDDLEDSLLVVVEIDGDKVGIVVDELLGQQQVVIKSLEQNYRRVDGISGATILGDGTVALILDIAGIIKLSSEYIGTKTQTIANVIGEFEGARHRSDIKLAAR